MSSPLPIPFRRAFQTLGLLVLAAALGAPARAVVPAERPHLLVSDTGNNRVLEVDPAGRVTWSFDTARRAGGVPGGLTAPGDAKAIGDFTGLTLPCCP